MAIRTWSARSATPRPTVELSDYATGMEVPRVLVDYTAMGCAVAEHFLERNFRRLIHIGWAVARSRVGSVAHSLSEHADREGVPVQHIDFDVPDFWRTHGIRTTASGLPWVSQRQGAEVLAEWLVRDKDPAAVFCGDPQFAVCLVDAGCDLGIHIPEQFALLTVPSYPHENELARIPISCIRRDCATQGHRAAESLDRLLRGEPVPEVQLVPPHPVDTLESTDTLSIPHLPAALAIKYFRDHALEYQFAMADAAAHLEVSLPTLHRWFKNYLERTPSAYIEERRIKRARYLFKHTRLSVEQVARQSGFTDHRQLRRAFCRRAGTTVQAFRDRCECGEDSVREGKS